jgi:cytochrome o ubiquinol oxidase subunit 1
VLHNSLFLVAHFHNVIIGGVLFGYLAGFNYWFPKAFGFKLNEKLGRRAFWFWLSGFYFAFMPLYVLGFMGMTRRVNHYDNPAFTPWLELAAFGALLIMIGIGHQLVQLYVSVRDRAQNLDLTGDPWNGRTLEWSVSSPPPFYNFAITPEVHALDALEDLKLRGIIHAREHEYQDIHMPRNTPAGLAISVCAAVMGFGLIWHIWWLAALGVLAGVTTLIWRTCNDDIDHWVPAAEVERIERAHADRLAAIPAGASAHVMERA